MKMSDFVSLDTSPDAKLSNLINYALHMIHEYKGKSKEGGVGSVAWEIINQTGLDAYGISPRELTKRYEQAVDDGVFE